MFTFLLNEATNHESNWSQTSFQGFYVWQRGDDYHVTLNGFEQDDVFSHSYLIWIPSDTFQSRKTSIVIHCDSILCHIDTFYGRKKHFILRCGGKYDWKWYKRMQIKKMEICKWKNIKNICCYDVLVIIWKILCVIKTVATLHDWLQALEFFCGVKRQRYHE